MRLKPTRVDQNSLGPPTSSDRIDDLLSFWAQWFSNRQVQSVFKPSLTVVKMLEAFMYLQQELIRIPRVSPWSAIWRIL